MVTISVNCNIIILLIFLSTLLLGHYEVSYQVVVFFFGQLWVSRWVFYITLSKYLDLCQLGIKVVLMPLTA